MNAEEALRYIRQRMVDEFGPKLDIPPNSLAELRQILRSGYSRATKREDVERFDAEVAILADAFAKEVLLERTADGVSRLSAASIGDILRRLCPIWPFC